MTRLGAVNTGRRDVGRHYQADSYCVSCQTRLTYGEPKASSVWPQRLRLSEEQLDLLLVAFAEFIEHGGGDPIDALDWVRPNALGLIGHHWPEFDGTAINEGERRVSEPFPLPVHKAPR